MKKRIIIIAILVAIITAIALFFWQRNHQSTSITLYGNVDIRSVDTSFQVSGRLVTMEKQEGDSVTIGEKLATIDSALYLTEQQKAQATLDAKEALLAMYNNGYRKEEIDQARAQVEQYQAVYTNALNSYDRQTKLIKTNATSKEALDNSLALRDQAAATLQAAKDKLVQLENGYRPEEIAAAKADVMLARANLTQAQLNVDYTILYAPSDGTILTKAVELGTFVAPGSTIYSITLIKPTWIIAYIDEVNLGQAIAGRTVYLSTDSNPNKTYIGQIGFVSPTAEFTPKTVQTPELRTDLVYRLRIVVNQTGDGATDDLLRQGMPVTIKFSQQQ